MCKEHGTHLFLNITGVQRKLDLATEVSCSVFLLLSFPIVLTNSCPTYPCPFTHWISGSHPCLLLVEYLIANPYLFTLWICGAMHQDSSGSHKSDSSLAFAPFWCYNIGLICCSKILLFVLKDKNKKSLKTTQQSKYRIPGKDSPSKALNTLITTLI